MAGLRRRILLSVCAAACPPGCPCPEHVAEKCRSLLGDVSGEWRLRLLEEAGLLRGTVVASADCPDPGEAEWLVEAAFKLLSA